MPDPGTFRPSQYGFAFDNTWPSQPAVVLATPLGRLNIGDARRGLCGGMVFAALDYWYAGIAPPAARPGRDEPLYGYIVRRLIDSWNLPQGATRYYRWMNLPDGERAFDVLGRHVVVERGLAWRTTQVQWPRIRAELDAGVPVALGLVTVASRWPHHLGRNHQVLAYDYRASDEVFTVQVYDPNQGDRDDMYIRFDAGTPSATTSFGHNLGLGDPVRGFFRAPYRRAAPPFG